MSNGISVINFKWPLRPLMRPRSACTEFVGPSATSFRRLEQLVMILPSVSWSWMKGNMPRLWNIVREEVLRGKSEINTRVSRPWSPVSDCHIMRFHCSGVQAATFGDLLVGPSALLPQSRDDRSELDRSRKSSFAYEDIRETHSIWLVIPWVMLYSFFILVNHISLFPITRNRSPWQIWTTEPKCHLDSVFTIVVHNQGSKSCKFVDKS